MEDNILQENYKIMRKHKFQVYIVIFLLTISAFYGGYYFGKRGYVFEIRKNPPKIEVINRSPSDSTVDFGLFWRVWDMVSTEYLMRPVDPQKMLYGAIEGMVKSLGDPYTSFLPPEVNKAISDALGGTYEGIGAELAIEEEQLIVVAPLDGSPAKDAGIRMGDKILKIEDESTVGITLTEAVAKIRGEAGTISTLTVQRGTDEPFVVRIKRGRIVVSSVSWEDKGDGVVYIRVSRFGPDTNKEWDKTTSQVNVDAQEVDSIILDLRGNPGGYLMAAVHIAGEFFQGKDVVYQESDLGEITPLRTERVGVFGGVPLYVLIDKGSASASEILAAALKAHAKALLVGEKSFGKGTIQDARDFGDGSGLHLTIAKWLTPQKEWVHEKGLEPDVLVERSAEDIQNGVDSQLNKALELAKQGVTDAKDAK